MTPWVPDARACIAAELPLRTKRRSRDTGAGVRNDEAFALPERKELAHDNNTAGEHACHASHTGSSQVKSSWS
jgi:hypothetical protein